MVHLIICVPATITFARKLFRNISRLPKTCACEPCTRKSERFKRKKRQYYTKPLFLLCLTCLGGGWFNIWHLSTRIYSSRQQLQIWDPFHLLGVSSFSSNIHIRKQYKLKSLKFHPDKQPKGMTKEEATSAFIDITKAYNT